MEIVAAIFTWLLTYAPYVAVYAGTLLLAVWGSVKITKFWLKTTSLHTDVPEMKSTLTKISTGLTLLNQVLLEGTVIKQSCYSNANSPRKINELGEKMLLASGARVIAEALMPELLQTLIEKNPTTALDVERESFRSILVKMNDERFSPIKNFAYENPVYQGNPLGYTDILFTMSLLVRDAYLEQHPEIRVED